MFIPLRHRYPCERGLPRSARTLRILLPSVITSRPQLLKHKTQEVFFHSLIAPSFTRSMAWPKANPTSLKITPLHDFSSCKTRREIITLPWIMSRGFSQRPCLTVPVNKKEENKYERARWSGLQV